MKTILCILFLFFSISFSYAEDNNDILVESQQEIQLPVGPVIKFMLLKPEMATITQNERGLTIKGNAYGTSPLYIWTENGIKIFNVNTLPIKSDKQAYFYKGTKEINNSYNGGYGININSNNSKNNSAQNISNTVNYTYNIDSDSSLDFRTSLSSNIFGYKNIQDLNLQNIYAKYKNKYWGIEFGDTSSSSGANPLNIISANVKGLKIYHQNIFNNFEFVSGLNYGLFKFYQVKPQNIYNYTNSYVNSLFDKYYFSKDLSIEGKFISTFDSQKFNNFNNNLLMSINSTSDIHNLSGSIATNFSSLAFSGSGSYIYKYNNNKEWLQPSANITRFADKYFSLNSKGNTSYGTSLRWKHITDTNLFSSVNFTNYDNYKLNTTNFDFGVQRPFFNNLLNTYISSNISLIEDFNNYTVDAGIDLNLQIPARINYRRTGNKIRTNDQVSAQLNILNLTNFKLNTNGSLGYGKDINSNGNTSGNIGLNLAWLGIKNFGISFASNFLFLNSTNYHDEIINLALNSNIVFPFYLISFSTNYQHSLTKSENNFLNFNIGYNYNFNSLLFKETGDLEIQVFDDKNNNKIFDKGESLIKNPAIIFNENRYLSDASGTILIKNLEYDNYNILLDNTKLPEGYYSTTDRFVNFDLSEKVKSVKFGVSKQYGIKLTAMSNKFEPLKEIKFFADGEPFITNINGESEIKTTSGKHKLKLDLTSVPYGYMLKGPDLQEIDVNSNNTEVYFEFQPLISVKGIIKNIKKAIAIKVKYLDENEQILEEKIIKTDADGSFYIFNIIADKLVISSEFFKDYQLNIPAIPADIKIEIKAYRK